MPPASKRRRTTSGGPGIATATNAAVKSAQSTLSFRSSKAGARSSDTKKADSHKAVPATPTEPLKVDIVDSEDEQTPVQQDEDEKLVLPAVELDDPTAKIFEKAEPGDMVEQEEDDEDEAEAQLNAKALGLSEAKIKSYWVAKERERKAPRVHQEGMSVREKVLREFDMSSRYGPSIGLTRLARWRRAHNIGLNPPIEVLAVLLKEDQIKGKASGTGGVHQRSIMDELILSSRINVAETA